MPTISQFYGIRIRMFFSEHAPPHFHAIYGDSQATIDINALRVLQGDLPRRAQELALDWAELHQGELLENWRLCAGKQQPRKVDPLA